MFALLNVLSLVGTVFVLGTYALMVRRPGPKREYHFNMANALAAPATLALLVVTGAFTVMPLTLAFGTIGAVGWYKHWRQA